MNRAAAGATSKPLPRWLPPLGAAMVRAWGATWRVRSQVPPEFDPCRTQRTTRCVYLLWHRSVLLASYVFRGSGVCIGVSQHGDGEIGARIAERLGFKTARGSSTRGAARLLLSMLDFAKRDVGDLALTPDGPKGPPSRTKPGALYLAGRLGWPVVPLVLVARPCKRLSSWDGFVLPAPFARVAIVAAPALQVEAGASDERLAQLCAEVDARMQVAEAQAEALAR